MKPWFDFFAQQTQRRHYLVVRDQTAAIELRQDAVDAELLLQRMQPLRHRSRGADQHLAGQRFLVGQLLESSESFRTALDRSRAGSRQRIPEPLGLLAIE